MNKAGGFIALHRQILDWEWYKDINTKVLFIHLLLKANYKELSFEGRKILRGQLVTSLPSLSSQTGLTVRQIRVSLDKLKMTGEVTSESYPRYRVITIVKYDEYQDDDSLDDSQMTGETAVKCQADDRLMTGSRQADDRLVTASKQYNNINKGTKKQRNNNTLSRSSEAFDFFWSQYPKRVAKQDALKAWNKLAPDTDLVNSIMTGLAAWKNSGEWTKDDGRFIPHPASWLNGRRWEDEIGGRCGNGSGPVSGNVEGKPKSKYEWLHEREHDRI